VALTSGVVHIACMYLYKVTNGKTTASWILVPENICKHKLFKLEYFLGSQVFIHQHVPINVSNGVPNLFSMCPLFFPQLFCYHVPHLYCSSSPVSSKFTPYACQIFLICFLIMLFVLFSVSPMLFPTIPTAYHIFLGQTPTLEAYICG